MRKRFRISMAFLMFGFAMVWEEGSAPAGVYTETFDSLNPSLWRVWTTPGASVELVNGRLKCSIPAHSEPAAWAIIESTFTLVGAFSAQVDYELTGPLVGTTATPGIEAIAMGNTTMMKCKRETQWEYHAGWTQYETITGNFYGNYSYHKVPGNLAGSLLLKRDPDMRGWALYNLGSGWVEVATRPGNYGNGSLFMGLWGWPAGAGTTVYFDNFIIDNVNIPEPVTLSLLAAGGLLLTIRHRRGVNHQPIPPG